MKIPSQPLIAPLPPEKKINQEPEASGQEPTQGSTRTGMGQEPLQEPTRTSISKEPLQESTRTGMGEEPSAKRVDLYI